MDTKDGVSGPITPDIKEDVKRIKLLFTKYGIMSDALALQFKMYPIACSSHSVGGDVRIDWDNKKVICNIFTDFYFKRVPKTVTVKGKTKTVYDVVPLKHKKALSEKKQKEYKKVLHEIYTNLTRWIPRLTWDDQTIMIIYVDNNRVQL